MKREVCIYNFHDYREFLKEVIKSDNHEYKSLREIARKSNLSPSFLSMVIGGTRNLDIDKSIELLETLGLNKNEVKYFSYLVELSDSKELQNKKDAYRKIKRFLKYRDRNTDNYLTFEYLEKWYNVVIRELSGREDFSEDVKWIQKQLIYQVSLRDIRKSLKFLKENNLLLTQSESSVSCVGGVYKLSLAGFHKQVLEKTVESIYEVDSTERNIVGHTVLLTEEEFAEVKEIMEIALKKIEEVKKKKTQDSRVYHLTLAAVPFS